MPFFVTNFHCVEREKFSFGKMADKAAVVGWLIPFSEEEIKKLIPLCGEEVLFNNRCEDYFKREWNCM